MAKTSACSPVPSAAISSADRTKPLSRDTVGAGRHHRAGGEDPCAGAVLARRGALRRGGRHARSLRIRRTIRIAIARNSRPTPTPRISQITPLTWADRIATRCAAPSGCPLLVGDHDPDVVDAGTRGGGPEQDGLPAAGGQLDRVGLLDLDVAQARGAQPDRDRLVEPVGDRGPQRPDGAGEGHAPGGLDPDPLEPVVDPGDGGGGVAARLDRPVPLGVGQRGEGLVEHLAGDHVVAGQHGVEGASRRRSGPRPR